MRIHHLAWRTRDVARLAAFYRDVVGLELTGDSRPAEATSVWLASGDARIMIEPRDADEPDVPPGSLELVAFAIPVAAREAFVARLTRAGVAVEARTAYTLYFRDPDGRRVAVSHYPERP